MFTKMGLGSWDFRRKVSAHKAQIVTWGVDDSVNHREEWQKAKTARWSAMPDFHSFGECWDTRKTVDNSRD